MRSRVIEALLPWQRVLLKIEVDYRTKCWNYIGARNNNGYGQIRWHVDGKVRNGLAHRIIYEKFCGPIPEGLEVCHTCDNKRCVNPAHLWHGTRAQNMKDAFDKGLTKGTFQLAVYNAFKEKQRAYQREWRRKDRERKRDVVKS